MKSCDNEVYNQKTIIVNPNIRPKAIHTAVVESYFNVLNSIDPLQLCERMKNVTQWLEFDIQRDL